MAKKAKKADTYSYKGWLVSDRLIKRSFAVVGHYMIAGLIIYGILLGVALVFLIIGLIIAGIIGLF